MGGDARLGVNSFFTYTFLSPCFTCVRPLEFRNTLRPLEFTFPVFITGLVARITGLLVRVFDMGGDARLGVNSFFTYTFLSPCFTCVRPLESLNTGRPLEFTFPVFIAGLFVWEGLNSFLKNIFTRPLESTFLVSELFIYSYANIIIIRGHTDNDEGSLYRNRQ